MVHYDDGVVHMPPQISGYKHAGNEVWYQHTVAAGDVWTECENAMGIPESRLCSKSLWIKAGVESHQYYLGQMVSG